MNSLLQAKRVLVDCRGLESALEAVRVSVEALRVLVEAVRVDRGLGMSRGCERLEKVPENVSRGHESVAEARKKCSKKLWNTSKHFGFVPKFQD